LTIGQTAVAAGGRLSAADLIGHDGSPRNRHYRWMVNTRLL
jgi:hypothetical protein